MSQEPLEQRVSSPAPARTSFHPQLLPRQNCCHRFHQCPRSDSEPMAIQPAICRGFETSCVCDREFQLCRRRPALGAGLKSNLDSKPIFTISGGIGSGSCGRLGIAVLEQNADQCSNNSRTCDQCGPPLHRFTGSRKGRIVPLGERKGSGLHLA